MEAGPSPAQMSLIVRFRGGGTVALLGKRVLSLSATQGLDPVFVVKLIKMSEFYAAFPQLLNVFFA